MAKESAVRGVGRKIVDGYRRWRAKVDEHAVRAPSGMGWKSTRPTRLSTSDGWRDQQDRDGCW